MQNSIWKLTALAGVIGLGFLIVLQMQGEIGQNQQAQNEVAPPREAGDDAPAPPIHPEELALSEPPVQDQWEPDADEPVFGSEPAEPDFPATASFDQGNDSFSEPPAFLSEPAVEPVVNELPDSAPFLAGTQDVSEEPARLPLFDDDKDLPTGLQSMVDSMKGDYVSANNQDWAQTSPIAPWEAA